MTFQPEGAASSLKSNYIRNENNCQRVHYTQTYTGRVRINKMFDFRFFEKIFFYSYEITLKVSQKFPWNQNEHDYLKKQLSEKELIIITFLMNFWVVIIVVNSMVVCCSLLPIHFPSLSNKVTTVLGIFITALLLLPVLIWWHTEHYKKSFLQYKNSNSPNIWFWRLITITFTVFLLLLPFIIMITL